MPRFLLLSVAVLALIAYVSGQDGFNMVPVSDAGFTTSPGYSAQNVHVKFDASGRLASVHPYSERTWSFNVGAKGAATQVANLQFSEFQTGSTILGNDKFIDSSPVGLDVANGYMAMTFQGKDTMTEGTLVFATMAGNPVGPALRVGFSPTDVKFISNGNKIMYIVVANQGSMSMRSADKGTGMDPVGSVSVIDVATAGGIMGLTQSFVHDVHFTGTLDASIRRLRDGATAAQDLQPNAIAGADKDMKKVFILLTDNNAIGIVDLDARTWTKVFAASVTDRGTVPFDPSDADTVMVNGVVLNDGVNINTWPNVHSYHMPSKGTTMSTSTQTYIFTANQGPFAPWHLLENNASDTVIRLGDIPDNMVDQSVVTNWAELKLPSNCGRLMVSTKDGKDATSGLYTKFYTFGGRSFASYLYNAATDSISLAADSGSDFESILAERAPTSFNAQPCEDDGSSCAGSPQGTNGKAKDSQSPYSGPSPSAVSTVTVGSKSYAIIASYTSGAFFVYDVTSPSSPSFYKFFSFREGDLGADGKWGMPSYTFNNYNAYFPDKMRNASYPEWIYSIRNGPKAMDVLPAAVSPSGYPMVAVMSSRSGSTQVYQLLPENCVPSKVMMKSAKLTASRGNVVVAAPEFELPGLGSQATAVAKVNMTKPSELTVYYKLYTKGLMALDWPAYKDCTIANPTDKTACNFFAFILPSSAGSQVYEGQLTSNVTHVPAVSRVAFSDGSSMCSEKATGLAFFVTEHYPQTGTRSAVTVIPNSPTTIRWTWSQL
jgi:archaellum component FlaF (FlaF/FlaG flagellin family)